ncbi:hypothetical protein Dgeo_2569 (plasmid) [Deinococcus geothermalis DSM 11300]|uniref:Uncharacterized protein n=1 Tax=Deinococcus geothermalis (strain DSM 11300 / CIP 105573 / AG-3a) TaxID=319795 RepID=Q1J3D1_DEIGD|nr:MULTISPECIES: hypothetical protein [Deinococcus]ABF44003.1 hypothetical protein Dgeo_2569 [Deinococcus geothermalis DSM 11300]MBI0445586.1 hypothetical protein [Deinococcus sp. DB0503]
MAYTIMLWLVNPGEQIHQDEAIELTQGAQRAVLPGAMSGVTEPPAATRLVYGVYDTQNEAATALQVVGEQLAQGRPLMVTLRGGHVFLIPAGRVHYAVMAEVVRPKDVRAAERPGAAADQERDRATARVVEPPPFPEQDEQARPARSVPGGGSGPGAPPSGPARPEAQWETPEPSPPAVRDRG